jgi:hypothetical protein
MHYVATSQLSQDGEDFSGLSDGEGPYEHPLGSPDFDIVASSQPFEDGEEDLCVRSTPPVRCHILSLSLGLTTTFRGLKRPTATPSLAQSQPAGHSMDPDPAGAPRRLVRRCKPDVRTAPSQRPPTKLTDGTDSDLELPTAPTAFLSQTCPTGFRRPERKGGRHLLAMMLKF